MPPRIKLVRRVGIADSYDPPQVDAKKCLDRAYRFVLMDVTELVGDAAIVIPPVQDDHAVAKCDAMRLRSEKPLLYCSFAQLIVDWYRQVRDELYAHTARVVEPT